MSDNHAVRDRSQIPLVVGQPVQRDRPPQPPPRRLCFQDGVNLDPVPIVCQG
jgi:hypothetical protein